MSSNSTGHALDGQEAPEVLTFLCVAFCLCFFGFLKLCLLQGDGLRGQLESCTACPLVMSKAASVVLARLKDSFLHLNAEAVDIWV